jgi:hypothetical protein
MKEKLPDITFERVMYLHDFIVFYVFSFLKFFDGSAIDEDPENYYMEREWRMLGSLNFRLRNVHRIILPESFAKQFREDIPEYFGQITFVD